LLASHRLHVAESRFEVVASGEPVTEGRSYRAAVILAALRKLLDSLTEAAGRISTKEAANGVGLRKDLIDVGHAIPRPPSIVRSCRHVITGTRAMPLRSLPH